MTAQHVGDKAGGAVFTADIGIGRWRGAGEPEDEGEIFFAFTELLTQVGFTFFEIGDQRLATIFDVENAGEIANFLIQPGHVPQLLPAAVHIAGSLFGGAHPRRHVAVHANGGKIFTPGDFAFRPQQQRQLGGNEIGILRQHGFQTRDFHRQGFNLRVLLSQLR